MTRTRSTARSHSVEAGSNFPAPNISVTLPHRVWANGDHSDRAFVEIWDRATAQVISACSAMELSCPCSRPDRQSNTNCW